MHVPLKHVFVGVGSGLLILSSSYHWHTMPPFVPFGALWKWRWKKRPKQPNQTNSYACRSTIRLLKEKKRNTGTVRRFLWNIKASTNYFSSSLGSQEEFKLQHEEPKLKILSRTTFCLWGLLSFKTLKWVSKESCEVTFSGCLCNSSSYLSGMVYFCPMKARFEIK